ncbi:MAG: YdaU family protein [Sterolibacterium sp.]
MKFYPHYISDFNGATRHLSRIERSIYRDLLDNYYDTELPLPLDLRVLCRLILAPTKQEKEALETVLSDFFQKTSQGWVHGRCESEIKKYHEMLNQKSLAGKASAAKRAFNSGAHFNSRSTVVEHPSIKR